MYFTAIIARTNTTPTTSAAVIEPTIIAKTFKMNLRTVRQVPSTKKSDISCHRHSEKSLTFSTFSSKNTQHVPFFPTITNLISPNKKENGNNTILIMSEKNVNKNSKNSMLFFF